jgi:hypothetical protein
LTHLFNRDRLKLGLLELDLSRSNISSDYLVFDFSQLMLPYSHLAVHLNLSTQVLRLSLIKRRLLAARDHWLLFDKLTMDHLSPSRVVFTFFIHLDDLSNVLKDGRVTIRCRYPILRV